MLMMLEVHCQAPFFCNTLSLPEWVFMSLVNKWSNEWWRLDLDVMERCKQVLFPAGFSMSRNKKVYTPQITLAYRYAESKTAPEEAESIMLEGQVGLEPTTPCLKGRCSNQLSY